MKLTYWAGMMDGQSSGNVLEFSGTGHKSKNILLKWEKVLCLHYIIAASPLACSEFVAIGCFMGSPYEVNIMKKQKMCKKEIR